MLCDIGMTAYQWRRKNLSYSPIFGQFPASTKLLFAPADRVTAADLLNDRVIPFFAEHRIDLLRVLTDRGTEYCGKVENNAYQLYLAVEDVDHTRTKANSPQTNGICERFHRTIKDEFYDIAFRKKLYRSVEELQIDLDAWLAKYNQQRPHSGRHCYGKTPMQTFRETLHTAVEKTIKTRDQSDSAQPILSVAG